MDQNQDRPMRKKVADFFRQAPGRYPVISVVLACVVLVLLLWIIPQWQVPKSGLSLKDRLHQINENRKTVAQIVGGVFILVGLYIAWVRSKAMRDQAEVAREQQLTDLYVKAVEQLGSENLQIRLGGIYALERIARESPKDHWPIMEVLTAFVRENAPLTRFAPSTLETSEKRIILPPPEKPPTDIQAVLTVLGRTAITYAQKGEKRSLDLHAIHLLGADLEEANFQGTIFWEANLEGAYLRLSKLQKANFREVNLQSANLKEADIQEANFLEADLYGSDLSYANIQKANLSGSDLQRAIFVGANLQQTDLSGSNLQDAVLSDADMQGANLKGANLHLANLIRGDLRGADFLWAKGLTVEQVALAIWDKTTRWPEGFSPPPQTEPKEEEDT